MVHQTFTSRCLLVSLNLFCLLLFLLLLLVVVVVAILSFTPLLFCHSSSHMAFSLLFFLLVVMAASIILSLSLSLLLLLLFFFFFFFWNYNTRNRNTKTASNVTLQEKETLQHLLTPWNGKTEPTFNVTVSETKTQWQLTVSLYMQQKHSVSFQCHNTRNRNRMAAFSVTIRGTETQGRL